MSELWSGFGWEAGAILEWIGILHDEVRRLEGWERPPRGIEYMALAFQLHLRHAHLASLMVSVKWLSL